MSVLQTNDTFMNIDLMSNDFILNKTMEQSAAFYFYKKPLLF